MNKNDYTCVKAMQIVKQKIDKMSITTSTNIDTLSVSSPVTFSVLPKKDTAKQLMNRLAGIDTNQPNVRPMSADVEVSLFSNAIRTKQSFKEFWSTNCHAYPRLITLVHRYRIIPATSAQVKDARRETIGSDEFPVISWQQCSVLGSCHRLPPISCRFLCQIWIFGYDRRFHCVSRLSFRLSTKLSESES